MFKSWKEHFWYTIPCAKARIESIVKRANGKDKGVLEVGCNEGFLSKALIEDGCNVVSVDSDKIQIDKAKEVFGIEAIQADINKLPFIDNSFDIAIGGEILEHLDNPMKGLQELFRVAREKVIISLPIGSYWLGDKSHKWGIYASIVDHDSGTLSDIEKQLIIIEFKKRELHENG